MEKPNVQDINALVNDEEIKEVETTEEVTDEVSTENSLPAEEVGEDEVAVAIDYNKLTVAELREKAKVAGVESYSKYKKDELIAILKGEPIITESNEECSGENCVCEDNSKSWLEVFLANYSGTSKEAQELQPFMKENYKGDVYLPWATMERLTYQCDPNARFIVLENKNGGIVHTDVMENYQYNGQKGEVISETRSLMFSHTVKVLCIFLGKEFVEDYPIQESDYSAARIYNQNLVNRSIQRAKAKVAARATGLALKLYEGFDLQFENKEETPKKPSVSGVVADVKVEETPVQTPKKEAPKAATPKKEEVKPVEAPKVELTDEQKAQNIVDGGEIVSSNEHVTEIINILRNNDVDKVNTMLQRVNVSIMSKYNFALSLTDSNEELVAKVSKFPEPEKFKKSIKALLGLE